MNEGEMKAGLMAYGYWLIACTFLLGYFVQ
jgi:hypothetical protein